MEGGDRREEDRYGKGSGEAARGPIAPSLLPAKRKTAILGSGDRPPYPDAAGGPSPGRKRWDFLPGLEDSNSWLGGIRKNPSYRQSMGRGQKKEGKRVLL